MIATRDAQRTGSELHILWYCEKAMCAHLDQGSSHSQLPTGTRGSQFSRVYSNTVYYPNPGVYVDARVTAAQVHRAGGLEVDGLGTPFASPRQTSLEFFRLRESHGYLKPGRELRAGWWRCVGYTVCRSARAACSSREDPYAVKALRNWSLVLCQCVVPDNEILIWNGYRIFLNRRLQLH